MNVYRGFFSIWCFSIDIDIQRVHQGHFILQLEVTGGVRGYVFIIYEQRLSSLSNESASSLPTG